MRRSAAITVVLLAFAAFGCGGDGEDSADNDAEEVETPFEVDEGLQVAPVCPALEHVVDLMERDDLEILYDQPVVLHPADHAGNPETFACTFDPLRRIFDSPYAFVEVTEFHSVQGVVDAWERVARSSRCAKTGCKAGDSLRNSQDDDYEESDDRTVQRVVDIQYDGFSDFAVYVWIGTFECTATFATPQVDTRPATDILAELEQLARVACPVVI